MEKQTGSEKMVTTQKIINEIKAQIEKETIDAKKNKYKYLHTFIEGRIAGYEHILFIIELLKQEEKIEKDWKKNSR